MISRARLAPWLLCCWPPVAAPARLELVVLKLSGNALTGCVPSALWEVAEHDLDSLGLPECEG